MSRGWFNTSVLCSALVGFLAVTASPRVAAAETPSVDQIVSRVQAVYERTKDLSANFVQVSALKSLAVSGPGGGLKEQRAEGKLYLKKPGMIRWDYVKPQALQLLSDGKTLWRYSPDDKTASKESLASAGRTPLSFLTGSGKIEQEFTASLTPGGQKPAGALEVELVPKEPLPTVQKLVLDVNRKNYQVTGITFWDHFGNRTVITFSDVQFNVGLPSSLFHFTPPAGVRVESLPGIPMWR